MLRGVTQGRKLTSMKTSAARSPSRQPNPTAEAVLQTCAQTWGVDLGRVELTVVWGMTSPDKTGWIVAVTPMKAPPTDRITIDRIGQPALPEKLFVGTGDSVGIAMANLLEKVDVLQRLTSELGEDE
jgi:hypothetical protein